MNSDQAKTLADVADHAFDKLSGGAAELAKAVKQVAPHAWEVAVRQQVIEGWTGLVAPALVLSGVITAVVLFVRVGPAFKRKCQEREKREYPRLYAGENIEDLDAFAYWLTLSVGGLFCVLAACVAVGCLIDGIRQLANPEYYAAKALLEALK